MTVHNHAYRHPPLIMFTIRSARNINIGISSFHSYSSYSVSIYMLIVWLLILIYDIASKHQTCLFIWGSKWNILYVVAQWNLHHLACIGNCAACDEQWHETKQPLLLPSAQEESTKQLCRNHFCLWHYMYDTSSNAVPQAILLLSQTWSEHLILFIDRYRFFSSQCHYLENMLDNSCQIMQIYHCLIIRTTHEKQNCWT